MGINQFTHLTQEEFETTYLGTKINKMIVNVDESFISVGDVDWVAAGAVTGVKNQGQCGSCWAFSSTGALEGLSKIAYGTLQSFSEQQLVDCSGSYGNQACSGGLMDNAFKYVKAQGITTEAAYPYKAVKGTCVTNSGAFKISGSNPDTGCNALATSIVSRPISVAVDARNWSTYKSGVFSNCATGLDHGVLLVGVTDAYWKVKNSWAASWGEAGYIRLARGNTCGICNQPSHPVK
jgi:C1A family cysteine protease